MFMPPLPATRRRLWLQALVSTLKAKLEDVREKKKTLSATLALNEQKQRNMGGLRNQQRVAPAL